MSQEYNHLMRVQNILDFTTPTYSYIVIGLLLIALYWLLFRPRRITIVLDILGQSIESCNKSIAAAMRKEEVFEFQQEVAVDFIEDYPQSILIDWTDLILPRDYPFDFYSKRKPCFTVSNRQGGKSTLNFVYCVFQARKVDKKIVREASECMAIIKSELSHLQSIIKIEIISNSGFSKGSQRFAKKLGVGLIESSWRTWFQLTVIEPSRPI